MSPIRRAVLLTAAAAAFAQTPATWTGKPWARHIIDNSSRGADGVKLIDINTDGRPDVTTGWEEGGVIRVYYNEGRVGVRSPWPQVTVGAVRSPEDALLADLDGDLAFDVVSACEGSERALFVHWAPKNFDRYFDAKAWSTGVIPASRDRMMWMFSTPMQVDGRDGVDLIAGGKGPGAAIGWMRAPANPRDLSAWTWHPLRPVGWIMSIHTLDMDGDGDLDILFSDRRGERSGVYWLDNPGPRQGEPWTEHTIGSVGREVMFIDVADFDGDGRHDVIAAVKPYLTEIHLRRSKNGRLWSSQTIEWPAAMVGTAKAVRVTDIDNDGHVDLVYSAERASGELRGVAWMNLVRGGRVLNDISGAPGVKYDLMELHDFDADGDLDILTTEETDGLGVVWYENPLN